jgi:hypothetical protein
MEFFRHSTIKFNEQKIKKVQSLLLGPIKLIKISKIRIMLNIFIKSD